MEKAVLRRWSRDGGADTNRHPGVMNARRGEMNTRYFDIHCVLFASHGIDCTLENAPML